MDRDLIERRDFSAARRGYDPNEVDQHLRRVAEEVERLEQERERSASLAGTAADRVGGIIAAAERSAAEIQERAQEEAARATSDADAQAQETWERAGAEAAAYVERVQQATGRIMERTATAEAEVDRLVQSLSSEADALLGALRGGAESLQHELEEVRQQLPELRETGSAGSAAGAGAAAGLAATAGTTTGGAASEVDVADDARDLPAEEVQDELASEEGTLTDAGVADRQAIPPFEHEVEGEAEAPEEVASPAGGDAGAVAGSEGARLIALNMALNGTPREETARYLEENFQLDDPDAVLDDVYSRVG